MEGKSKWGREGEKSDRMRRKGKENRWYSRGGTTRDREQKGNSVEN